MRSYQRPSNILYIRTIKPQKRSVERFKQLLKNMISGGRGTGTFSGGSDFFPLPTGGGGGESEINNPWSS